ncbi:hypothetical protein SUGI_0451230 [Cryptomeria japonica]|uniref:uncharacterized protein At1g01500 n=1 Tax=Cryptomeria japonica TaxID=3369 RepID=UPI002408C8B7|nr:uncharacterized protein At1g01500 [Cryptomeria japonica]GLJ23781.1 hypothetical protein SUGI_0451230 [Cryptomeria japonica]
MCQISARPFSSTPLYARASYNNNQQLWFDMKVFYIRLAASMLNNLPAPESLTVHCLPGNSNRSALEINGRRIHPSCSSFLTLERSRADEKSSDEVAYVSTDSIRVTGTLCFQVFLRDKLLISGTLEKKATDQAITTAEDMNEKIWSLQCSCKLEYTSKWPFQTLSVPSLDVFVAGRMLGFPLILTQSVQMIPRKKRLRQGSSLDVIPEGNEAETEDFAEISSDSDLESDDYSCSESSSSVFFDSSSESNNGEREFEPEEEDSWFNSGLGFGLGLGLGMLGVGLLVNSKGMRKRIL